jgi:antitoxin component YwqK of YwqJK toxin-antitoxin module
VIDGNYKGGEKDGLWTDWLEGQEGAYKGGEKDGLWTWWDEQGNITKQITYKNGKEVP